MLSGHGQTFDRLLDSLFLTVWKWVIRQKGRMRWPNYSFLKSNRIVLCAWPKSFIIFFSLCFVSTWFTCITRPVEYIDLYVGFMLESYGTERFPFGFYELLIHQIMIYPFPFLIVLDDVLKCLINSARYEVYDDFCSFAENSCWVINSL